MPGSKNNRLTAAAKGFTLVEVIVYVGIIALIMTAMVQFLITLFSVRTTSGAQTAVGSALNLLSTRLIFEIRQAKSINYLTATAVSLASFDPARDPTVFELQNGRIYLGSGLSGTCTAAAPCPFTAGDAAITAFTLQNISTGDTSRGSIRFSLTAESRNYSASLTGSAAIRSK